MTGSTADDPLRPVLDADSLREVDVDAAAYEQRADALADATDAVGLAERSAALRLLGRHDEAEQCAWRAVAAAESEDALAQVARARIRLAEVLDGRSRTDEAEAEYAAALADAAQLGDEELRAEALYHRAVSRFHAGRLEDSERDFTTALQIHRRRGASEADIEAAEQGVAAVVRRLVASGHR